MKCNRLIVKDKFHVKSFLASFAKSKGDNSALTKAIRVKIVFTHSLFKNNMFAKFRVNQVEIEGKVLTNHHFQSKRAINPQ